MRSIVVLGENAAGFVHAKLIFQSQCFLRLKRKNMAMLPMAFALNSNVAVANDESLETEVFSE